MAAPAAQGKGDKPAANPRVGRDTLRSTIDIIANAPEEFARYIESEYTKWAQLLKAAGTRVE